MRTLILFLVFSACLHTVHAKDKENTLKRLSLMSYVTHVETLYPYNLEWSYKSAEIFNLFSKAYAYKEGDPCLILGFQSTYKNGMCRLSLADGAKEYRGSCSKGKYACNPQVFGSTDSKPFCVSAALGSEL